MTEKTLLTYKSRRNHVRLVQIDTERYVIKSFSEEEGFKKELEIYNILQKSNLPCAKVIMVGSKNVGVIRAGGNQSCGLPGRTRKKRNRKS